MTQSQINGQGRPEHNNGPVCRPKPWGCVYAEPAECPQAMDLLLSVNLQST